jgi:hypothetical protein
VIVVQIKRWETFKISSKSLENKIGQGGGHAAARRSQGPFDAAVVYDLQLKTVRHVPFQYNTVHSPYSP